MVSSRFFRPALIVAFGWLIALPVSAAVELATGAVGTARFPLVVDGRAAPILLPPEAPEVVRIAARELAADIAAVTGITPEVRARRAQGESETRVELLFAPDLKGRWEAFRLSATETVLTVSASDARGLAYGALEVSRRFGVSPWRWWADVPAPRLPAVWLSVGVEPVEQPAVKYRGIFINDEDWGLEPWASKTYEPEAGNIGPRTYARVFELMLRLRANLLWPGMHPTTTPFHVMPGNAAVADAHAIIVGSSHAEPMLLNNGREWPDEKSAFNYLTNRERVRAYWEQRVVSRQSGESQFTIGMRGINDSPIIGPRNQRERIETLERVFTDQREMLGRLLGGGDATRVSQIFCPYKEVLEDYLAGLRVPEDVVIVWPDDNFGYIRRHATPEEKGRKGGLGVYYHASYSGMPQSWLWIDVQPPALIWSEMMRAYEHGASALWMVNVGDIKNTERSAEYFLELAWRADRVAADHPVRFVQETAVRDFGREEGPAIAALLARLQLFSAARRAEHLQWHLSLAPYLPTELNEAEIKARLAVAAELQAECARIMARLPASHQDAFFELVGYPVAITVGANRRYFHDELARADVVRGRDPGSNLKAAADGQVEVTQATRRYNEEIAGGKWRHVVSENGYSPGVWPRFQRDVSTVRPEPSADNVAPPAPPTPGELVRPEGARAGDFVERDRVVSLHAGHFSETRDAPSGVGWRAVPGLGRTGSAITVLPTNRDLSDGEAPEVGYRFFVTMGGGATLRARLLPTHPIIAGRGLRVKLSVDEHPAIELAVTEGFEPKRSDMELTPWQRRVLANATEVAGAWSHPIEPGWHTLRLTAVDAAVVVDKLLIEFAPSPASYDGPQETRLP